MEQNQEKICENILQEDSQDLPDLQDTVIDSSLLSGMLNFSQELEENEMDTKLMEMINQLDPEQKNEILNSMINLCFSIDNEKKSH